MARREQVLARERRDKGRLMAGATFGDLLAMVPQWEVSEWWESVDA